ncbi:hypothetical protein BD289DRAFT_476655 [Coniella lustricola]|uniref:Zn(2)-C6 fungal-type domain-containing protein n=1 Tax=Coniella lustricola TaxID=2025994 RepID=A0A2T2ZXW0_9PEZI|nr:hypothetical protein BD289DRAFT_476655 [Coniella lustricola]
MEHLETQVSDLRSFLPGSLVAPPGPVPAVPHPHPHHHHHHHHTHHSSASASPADATPMPTATTPLAGPASGTASGVVVGLVGGLGAAAGGGGAGGGLLHGHNSSNNSSNTNTTTTNNNLVANARASHAVYASNMPSPSPAASSTSRHLNHSHTHNSNLASPTWSALGPPKPTASSSSSSAAAAASVAKRKTADSPTDDSGQKQHRSKRNRYISIACNECKRRKIKCNGETPCQRCGNLNLQCLYAPNCCSNQFKDSDEYKAMTDTLALLQDQMESLQRKVSDLQQETMRLAPLHDRVLPPPPPSVTTNSNRPSPGTPASTSSTSQQQKPDAQQHYISRPPARYRGPTSASAHVNVAKDTLYKMGFPGEANDTAQDPARAHEDEANARSPLPPPPSDTSFVPRCHDPLWEYDKDEMVRLCRVHEEEVGIMYPVVNIEDVIAHATHLADRIESTRRYGASSSPRSLDDEFSDTKTLELKIIMCCALVVEEHGYSTKATRLWDSIQHITNALLMSEPSDVAKLPFLALVGGFRFLANEEVLAWRVMGQVARLCLEMGLHRRDGIARIAGEQERKNAINTFWSAYVLDRRWSFGTGFPFVVHDDKIDPGLPWPENYPYLTCLITISKLTSKIWRLVDYFDSVLIRDLKREDFENLDQEILDWYETLPESIKISSLGNLIPSPGTRTYNIERLQIWTRLRLNQIRIWLYTPVLHTALSISQNRELAQRVVSLAQETIQYLSLLNNNSVVYHRIQVFYHHFLTSAIAVLFLASTHAPVAFSSMCREEFHMALELVKDLSSKSWVSQRLWRTVKSLKAYAPRLGLQLDEDVGSSRRGEHGGSSLSVVGPARQHSAGHGGGVMDTSLRSPASSGGPLSASSPGLTPGYGGQQPPASRMGSLTPHGGRHPSLPGSGGGGRGAQANNQGREESVPSPDDAENGRRLQTEMWRMFEGFASGAVQQQQQQQGTQQGTQLSSSSSSSSSNNNNINNNHNHGSNGGADEYLVGREGDYSTGSGEENGNGSGVFGGMGGDIDGVYQYMKEMF